MTCRPAYDLKLFKTIFVMTSRGFRSSGSCSSWLAPSLSASCDCELGANETRLDAWLEFWLRRAAAWSMGFFDWSDCEFGTVAVSSSLIVGG